MSSKYKFSDQDKLYFISFAVINWIDVFVRKEYKDILIDSFKLIIGTSTLNTRLNCILAPVGAFPEVYRNAPLSSERGFRFFMSHSSDFSRHYFRVWEQQGIKSFIYEIPRRFRTLIPFTPRFY